MKRIAIVSNGYAWLPCESGPSRFYYIANQFVKFGWDVEIFTVDFQHFKKEKRDLEQIKKQNYPFKITFIKTPPYKKNVSIKRVFSNIVVEKRLKKELSKRMFEFDVIYCSIPANNIASMTSKLCKNNNIPLIVDIEDLWPEAMRMVVKNNVLFNILFSGMKKDAEETYENASGVIGTSEDYTARAFKYQKRNIPNSTVYVGCDLANFDHGVIKYSNEVKKNDDEFWVTYTGSISTSYDIKTLIEAARTLKNENVFVQLLGTGSNKSQLEEYVNINHIDNVLFWGFTDYHKMAAVLSKSDVVINSFVKGAPQSIVNKVGDYLASGKPMINTLENPMFCELVNKNKVGVNVEPENVQELVKAILYLKENNNLCKELGDNARNLAETRFDRERSYAEIVEMAEKLIR